LIGFSLEVEVQARMTLHRQNLHGLLSIICGPVPPLSLATSSRRRPSNVTTHHRLHLHRIKSCPNHPLHTTEPPRLVGIQVDISVLRISNFPATFDMNLWFTTGDLSWIMTASALVWLMIPGSGLYYSGMVGEKSAISLLLLSAVTVSIITFQVLAVLFMQRLIVVVRLGIFTHVLQNRVTVYRRLCKFRSQGGTRTAKRLCP
jgi:hypothetical protein